MDLLAARGIGEGDVVALIVKDSAALPRTRLPYEPRGRGGDNLDSETLAIHCRAHLAKFKVPQEMVIRDALPRNPSRKVLKRVLREGLQNR